MHSGFVPESLLVLYYLLAIGCGIDPLAMVLLQDEG